MAGRYHRRPATHTSLCEACPHPIEPGQIITYNPHLRSWVDVQCRTGALPYGALAEATWPWAHWITGNGRWATVAPCRVLTVNLHRTRREAKVALDLIDHLGCGGECRGASGHQLVDLAAPR